MKINIEYDTNDNKLVVVKDGEQLSNVDYVEFYPKNSKKTEFSLSLRQSTSEEDVQVYTTTYAKEALAKILIGDGE